MLKESAYPNFESGQDFVASWSPESFEPGRIKDLVRDLLPDEESRQGRCFGLHVVEGADEHSDVARHIEHTVFNKRYGNDLNTMRAEYGDFDNVSAFLLVLDYEKEAPAAALRIIKPSDAGLKSMNDLAGLNSPWNRESDSLESRWLEIGNDPEHTVDILTMAVMPEYRSNHAMNGASAALYSSCVRWSLSNGYNRWVSIMEASDKSIYNMIQSWGEPFITFDGAEKGPYLGSGKSVPVYTELYSGLERIRQFDQKMTEQFGQPMDVHGLYTKGTGLDEQFVLPAFSDTVQ